MEFKASFIPVLWSHLGLLLLPIGRDVKLKVIDECCLVF